LALGNFIGAARKPLDERPQHSFFLLISAGGTKRPPFRTSGVVDFPSYLKDRWLSMYEYTFVLAMVFERRIAESAGMKL